MLDELVKQCAAQGISVCDDILTVQGLSVGVSWGILAETEFIFEATNMGCIQPSLYSCS